MLTKICSKCKEEKYIILFYERCKLKEIRRNICKECHSIKFKEYRAQNKDKIKEQTRKYRLTDNYKKLNAVRQIRYRKNHLEKVKERQKKWIENNREKKIAYKSRDISILRDSYVKYFITRNTSLKYKDIPDSFVKCYRVNIKLKRLLREIKK